MAYVVQDRLALRARRQPIGVGVCTYAAGEVHPEHRHERSTLSMVLAGGLSERSGSSGVSARPLSVVTKPAGVEHEDRFGDGGCALIQVEFPAGSAWDSGAWSWQVSPQWANRLGALAEELLQVRPDRGHLLELVEPLLSGLPGPAPRPSKGSWIDEVTRVLEARLDDPPPVKELAEQHGVHAGSLTRAFRRVQGTSIQEHVQRRRLARATDCLVGEDEDLAAIAARCGYSDQSHFTRVFRRRVGVAPGGYRRMLRGLV